MVKNTCKKQEITKDIIDAFSDALLNKNVNLLESLLDDNGQFNIQTERLNTIVVNKKRFLSWMNKRLKNDDIHAIEKDTCLHCSMGATVLLINKGQFPRQIKNSAERSKTGLMLETNNNSITQIKFCYVFTKTENLYVFEEQLRGSIGPTSKASDS